VNNPPLSAEHTGTPDVLILRMCPVPVQSADITPPRLEAPGLGNWAAVTEPAISVNAGWVKEPLPLVSVVSHWCNPAAALGHANAQVPAAA